MSNQEIQNLLKVLDLREEEQTKLLKDLYYDNEENDAYSTLIDFYMGMESLADLAFRLRDEARKSHPEEWLQACFIVSEFLTNPQGGRLYTEAFGYEAEHEILSRGSVVWITTTLIAEELYPL